MSSKFWGVALILVILFHSFFLFVDKLDKFCISYLIPHKVMRGKFNLTWHSFSTHQKDLFKDLKETQRYSDVTLVSDDQYHFKAHKFILSASSTVLQSKLDRNPNDAAIFLKGVNHEELESILQYIYLGEATLYIDRMNQFFMAVRELKMKEVGKNIANEDFIASKEQNNKKISIDYGSQISEFEAGRISTNLKKDASCEESVKLQYHPFDYEETQEDQFNNEETQGIQSDRKDTMDNQFDNDEILENKFDNEVSKS